MAQPEIHLTLCSQLWALQTASSIVACALPRSFTIFITHTSILEKKIKEKKKSLNRLLMWGSKEYLKSCPSLYILSKCSTHLNLYLSTPELYLRKNCYKFECWERQQKAPGISSSRAGMKKHNQHLQWPIVIVKTSLPDYMSLGRDISIWSR